MFLCQVTADVCEQEFEAPGADVGASKEQLRRKEDLKMLLFRTNQCTNYFEFAIAD